MFERNPERKMPLNRPLHVCYFGTYRAEYPRNQIVIEGLRRNGIKVTECHQPLWRGIEDRIKVIGGGWSNPEFWGRVIRTYFRLMVNYSRIADYDLLMVGYPGQLDVFLARVLSLLKGRPLGWDVFMSIYLIALERGLGQNHPQILKVLRRIEGWALRLPHLLVIDTRDYALWMQDTHGIKADRFSLVPTGADDRVFHRRAIPPQTDRSFLVLYYGTFIPNHGVEFIVEAAFLLREQEGLRFEFIGDGPDRPKIWEQAQKYRLKNLTFIDWLDKEALVLRIQQADICLGAFGTTPQSVMTVQNKIYEGLAMAKPVITGDSPAVRRNLTHGENIWVCRRADPQALAEAIQTLYANPALTESLGEKGYETFISTYDLKHIGQTLSRAIEMETRPQ